MNCRLEFVRPAVASDGFDHFDELLDAQQVRALLEAEFGAEAPSPQPHLRKGLEVRQDIQANSLTVQPVTSSHGSIDPRNSFGDPTPSLKNDDYATASADAQPCQVFIRWAG